MKYFSIRINYNFNEVTEDFVWKTSQIIFQKFPFKEHYCREGKQLSLQKILEENQKALTLRSKKIGFHQILLQSKLTHLRQYYSIHSIYPEEGLVLYIVAEQCDITWRSGEIFEKKKLLPLLDLSKELWEKTSPSLVQTFLEDDITTFVKDINNGKKVSAFPFSIVKSELSNQLPQKKRSKNIKHIKIANDGTLYLDMDQLSFSPIKKSLKIF